MRLVTLLGLLAVACSEPKFVPKPLPALVAPTSSQEMQPIAVGELGFTEGERFVWAVRVRGFQIGNGELTVRENAIISRFATTALAAAFATVEHDLTTVISRGKPETSHERLELDGKIRQFATTFTGTTSHSLHTALGVLRVWARGTAAPGFLHVVVNDKLARVELARPLERNGLVRVDAKIVGLDEPATMTCWIDHNRHITRIEIRADGEQVTADLVQ